MSPSYRRPSFWNVATPIETLSFLAFGGLWDTGDNWKVEVDEEEEEEEECPVCVCPCDMLRLRLGVAVATHDTDEAHDSVDDAPPDDELLRRHIRFRGLIVFEFV